MTLKSLHPAVAAIAIVSAITAAVIGQGPTDALPNVDWSVYRGDPKANQYAPLAQIHAANVHELVPVWEYHTGDATERSTMHVNPIVVDGVMYVTTPSLKAVALDARTGREIWSFDPSKHNAGGAVIRLRNRGVVHWKGAGGERIFHFVKDRVYALDAKSGRLIESFGQGGRLDLREHLGVNPATVGLEMTSPGAVYKGWVHLNGAHTYTVEEGAIVGRTVESSASMNSFLCTTREFDDFELELETMVDRVTNQGIQIRSRVRPVRTTGRSFESSAGRVNGPQVEVRRFYKGLPTTGLLYGEALGTNWLSSQQKIDAGHGHFIDEGWNKLRIVADGPRIRTWVNGNAVEDLVNEEVYKTHPRGFIGLQIHGVSEREINTPLHAASGVTVAEPLISRWRNIRIRPIANQRIPREARR
jgi:hypothetical protein